VLPVDFLGETQCWWLFGFGKDYSHPVYLDDKSIRTYFCYMTTLRNQKRKTLSWKVFLKYFAALKKLCTSASCQIDDVIVPPNYIFGIFSFVPITKCPTSNKIKATFRNCVAERPIQNNNHQGNKKTFIL
jgi:REP element-mobilizing transposase RayT